MFHIRGLINEKANIFIVDSGSCTKVASVIFIEKTFDYSSSKSLWSPLFNDRWISLVHKEVKIPFIIGKYDDEVISKCNAKECGSYGFGETIAIRPAHVL